MTTTTYRMVTTASGSAVHLATNKDGPTLCGREVRNRPLPATDRMCVRCEKASLSNVLAAAAEPEPEQSPRCAAHGQERCILCSRIGSAYIVDEGSGHPQCCGCEHWGATGMHWDTCPCRIHGDILIHPMFREDG